MIRSVVITAVALAAVGTRALAQQTRAELLRTATTAYDDFAPDRAADLLKAAVNPALGPADTAWARGVHLLTQILVEGGNRDLARTWARWAARHSLTMTVDTVNFVAGAVAVLREARTFANVVTAGDAVTRTSWRWVARGSSEPRGRILLDPVGMPVPVNVRVVGVGIVPAGAVGLSLAPGSYEVEAAAPGYLPARFTREVLPGVTTVLGFGLTSAAVASDVIGENVRQRLFRNVAALSVRRFGGAPSCAVGSFMSRDGLLLTSYQAIRGAEGITAEAVPGGTGTPGIRVAAYDAAAGLAVLHVPGARTDSIVPATVIADGQSGWAIRFPDCRTPSESRTRVTQWTDRPRGALQLSDAPLGAAVGSPLVDVEGRLSAIWSAGLTAVPSSRALALLDVARRNVTQAQLLAVSEVSRRENHAYGSVLITADMTGATARVTPLEPWHWDGLQAGGNAPYTFSGPMGRYRVEVTGPGNVRREQEVTIRPGAQERLIVALRSVAVAPQSTGVQPRKSNRKIWIIAGIGGVGAAAALALAGGGGKEPPGTTPPTTGTITIQIPVNPPVNLSPLRQR